MTTIIQKMWRDGVPGPDGGLVQVTERPQREEYPVYKCSDCDGVTISISSCPDCTNCSKPLFESERL